MTFKKQMIFDGSRYGVLLVEAAHHLGVPVLTADNLPDNAAHKVSDEYCRDRDDDDDAVSETIQRVSSGGMASFAYDSVVLSVTCGV